MGLYALIHQRLGVARFVSFVVAQAAKSDHVEHNILLILLAIVECDTQSPISGFRIVSIDMKDGRLGHARDVGRIDR